MSLTSELQPLNHHISLIEAITLTTRFRNSVSLILKPELTNQEVLPVSETFKKSAFADLLAQPGAVAIRAYLGMSQDNKVRLVFVAVDDENQEILPQNPSETGFIVEYGQ